MDRTAFRRMEKDIFRRTGACYNLTRGYTDAVSAANKGVDFI